MANEHVHKTLKLLEELEERTKRTFEALDILEADSKFPQTRMIDHVRGTIENHKLVSEMLRTYLESTIV